MLAQEKAFRAYYASMTDDELVATAANRNSFIELAQQVLGEEMTRRNLELPPLAHPPLTHEGSFRLTMRRLLHQSK